MARVEALGIGMGVSMDLAKITAGAALELLNDVEHGPETARDDLAAAVAGAVRDAVASMSLHVASAASGRNNP